MRIILTTMCMAYKNDGSFLVQNRKSKDWPGINFPGGKIEEKETIIEGCKREMKEETNLEIRSLENCGSFEWYDKENEIRHLAILFRTNDFDGNLKSSNEGEVFFLKEKDLEKFPLSIDFDKILKICKKGLNI